MAKYTNEELRQIIDAATPIVSPLAKELLDAREVIRKLIHQTGDLQYINKLLNDAVRARGIRETITLLDEAYEHLKNT